jgi:hypothetical protein
MTVNNSRPKRESLIMGTTEGKYRNQRPNTEVARGTGEAIMEANREGLNPFYNYGYMTSEAGTKVNPGGN